MFQTFHIARTWKSKKGQLAPLFIVVLVVMLIMTLVTVNLNKVAFYKTGSSNAADAGGLAGGSVMANLFNSIAVSNSYLEVGFWEFYVGMAAAVVILDVEIVRTMLNCSEALALMAAGSALACALPCAAEGIIDEALLLLTDTIIDQMQSIILAIAGLIATVTWFWIGQKEYLGMIQDTAVKGRQVALQMGHKFALMNSGVSGRLKAGNPPGGASALEQNFYQNKFTEFMNDIKFEVDGSSVTSGIAGTYSYAWKDPDQRDHHIDTSADTQNVLNYRVQVTALPYPGVMILLTGALVTAILAYVQFTAAITALTSAVIELFIACICWEIWIDCLGGLPWTIACVVAALECWLEACLAAIPLITTAISTTTTGMIEIATIMAVTAAAMLSLLPLRQVETGDGPIDETEIPAWIDDVIHDRKFLTSTSLYNKGAVLGLWNTTYPSNNPAKEISSWTETNFTGEDGRIYPWNANFDPSINLTDSL